MGLFDSQFNQIAGQLEALQAAGVHMHTRTLGPMTWPQAAGRNLIMNMDTAVELGHPKLGSMAFLIWIDDSAPITNRRMTLIGPDIADIPNRQIPFGKIVRLRVHGLTPDNTYDHYRILENVRFDLRLHGYMLRGVSHYGREWSRVSRTAIREGFSFAVLASALMDRYLALDFVEKVDIVFITAGLDVMRPFMPLAEQTLRITAAMNKMVSESVHDCDTCDYSDVCSDVAELQRMRRSMLARGGGHHA